jgi:hypothetical protein
MLHILYSTGLAATMCLPDSDPGWARDYWRGEPGDAAGLAELLTNTVRIDTDGCTAAEAADLIAVVK